MLLFEVVSFLVNLLPLRVSGFLGKKLGDLIKLLGMREEVARKNMKKALQENPAFEKEIDISLTLKNCYRHLGQLAVEFLLLDSLQGRLSDFHEIKGEDNLEKAFEKGNGVIVYTAHFGNWEWLGSVLAEKGYPVTAIARTQKQAAINSRINELRTKQGLELVSDRNSGVRKAIKELKLGNVLIILGDQHAPHGTALNFFNWKASVFGGAVQIASRYNAPIVPAFSVRKGFANFCVKIEPFLELPENLSTEEEKYWLKKLLRITEAQIGEYPSQWLWLHRRWKLD